MTQQCHEQHIFLLPSSPSASVLILGYPGLSPFMATGGLFLLWSLSWYGILRGRGATSPFCPFPRSLSDPSDSISSFAHWPRMCLVPLLTLMYHQGSRSPLNQPPTRVVFLETYTCIKYPSLWWEPEEIETGPQESLGPLGVSKEPGNQAMATCSTVAL